MPSSAKVACIYCGRTRVRFGNGWRDGDGGRVWKERGEERREEEEEDGGGEKKARKEFDEVVWETN